MFLLKNIMKYDIILLIIMSKKKPASKQTLDKPSKKYKFYLGSRERYITIRSDFDSGNIDFVRQISQFQYRLASVFDGTFTDHRVNSKSWFHFSVQGFPSNTKGKFFVGKVQTLQSIYYSKYNKTYRPVFKVGEEGQWKRLETQTQLVMRQNSELQCVFEYTFKSQNDTVYFAFCYPFSYIENIRYLQSLNDYLFCDEFYLHKQILIHSPEKRQIHLLTITSYDHQDKINENEVVFNEELFPQRVRPMRFKKPVVLISARVHPGQTPASFTMKGVIDFLTSKTDLRAHLLRKMFVFMIVPMINVDGVYHGHFRMDIQGKNLNRYYIKPCPQKQPAIYAIKELADHLNQQNRLSFYFDLHAHNAKKGCFIYGNAINDFVEQVESQVFCKLISMNNRGFEYEYCNFTQKHMNAKDKNEDLTKEGCGRVVMYKLAKIIHSYSVECGIISVNKLNLLSDPLNQQFTLEDKRLPRDPCQDNYDKMYKTKTQEPPLFTPEMYENLGKNLMVSILDVFDKNPYNRVYNSRYKSMDMLRRLTAFEIFHEAQRFRMFERFVFGKVKNINQLIRQVLNTKLHYKKLYNFYFFDDKQLKHVQWPKNIPGLSKPKIQSPLRTVKAKPFSASNQYAQSFLKALKINLEKMNPNYEVDQQEIVQDEENNSSVSSETQDYSPEKRLPSLQEEIFLDQEKEEQQMNIKKQLTRSEIHFIDQDISFRLKGISHDGIGQYDEKKKQNPGLRVRRLLKQDFTSGSFKSDRQILAKNQFEEENQMIRGAQIKKNIYDSIKEEIKNELKKEKIKQSKKKSKRQSQTSQVSGYKNISSPVKVQRERIKSWTIKKNERAQKNKVQLPALGSQMYIISTSAKTFLKKN